MARSGRFGRAPRTAPSLTSTIIALAREYQNTRDTNIMNAWEKGGTFEGKKVTDKMVLKHWKERVNGVSKDDPLHDTYTQAVENLTYTIAESKMTAAYALKKKSDSQMVQFYLGWAKKVPKDSEFYRVLQRDAGQYMRTAKQTNQAEIARLKEERYQKQQGETDKKYGAAAQFLTDTMRRLNQSGFADGHLSATLDAPGTKGSEGDDLTNFDPSDPETSMKLLQLIAPEATVQTTIEGPNISYTSGTGEYKANDAVLYHSDTIADKKTGAKKPVTGADIVAELAKLDPGFKPGQPIDVAYLTHLLDRQNVGLQEQIDRATKTGHMQDADRLTQQKGYIATLTRQVAAWPIEKAYLDLRETYDAVANDPTASPFAQEAARTQYEHGLAGLRDDPRIASNDNMRTRIQGEIDGKTDMPTLADSFTGAGVGNTKDAALQAGRKDFVRSQIETVQRDAVKLPDDPTKNVWTYGTTNESTGVFTPSPNGTEIGVATVDAVKGSGLMPQTITIDDPRGGKGLQVMVTAVPVVGTAKDPVTNDPLPPQNNAPIAYAYNIPQGGQPNVKYGFLVKDPADPTKSVMNFTGQDTPPWADDLPVSASSNGGNHYEVDFSSVLPTQPATTGPAGSVESAVDLTKPGGVPVTGPDGKPLAGFNVSDVGRPTANNLHPTGILTWDPYSVARGSDVERNALGSTDPITDHTSLTVANLIGTVDGRNILKDIDNRPEFKAQATDDGFAYAGAVRDPKTGAWDPTTADPAKLSAAEQQANLMKNAASFTDLVKQAGLNWQRLTTGSPYPNNAPPQPGQSRGLFGQPNAPISKLATELTKDTPFAPIAQAFFGGTLTKKPVPEGGMKDEQMFRIGVGKGITVPAYEAKTVTSTATNVTGVVGGATSAVKTVGPGAATKPAPMGNPYGPNGVRAL